ncbi:gamma-glutamyltransferase family protein [Halanaerobium hydrogeniformans]
MASFSKRGMVATSQALASQAGLEILKKSGNAVDAAVAAAACLTVVEPCSNGIGSDAFAMVWIDNQLYGLNSSGPAPKSISIQALKDRNITAMPKYGFIPVTVSGAPAAWAELNERFGSLSLAECLAPAVKYAREGFAITPLTAAAWKRAFAEYKKELKGEEFEEWFKVFVPGTNPPEAGEVWHSKDHAETLEKIATTNAKSFYQGEIAQKIVDFSNKYGGFLQLEDYADFSPEWVEPLSVNYRGYDVWELPPNGQGLVALMALNILKHFDISSMSAVERYHRAIEALKLAFSAGKKYITDSRDVDFDYQDFLTADYALRRKELITDQAISPPPGNLPAGGTVYLAAADSEGNYVSFIQSNYMGFGSGLVVPGTGVALQNRGHNFSLDPEAHNALKGGKRSYHTIIPGFLTKNGKPIGPFGVMGGFMQPQGHLQLLINTIDLNLNPQAALDAPRWQWIEDKKIKLEADFPEREAKLLAARGHEIELSLDSSTFGKGQMIWRDQKEEVLIGGTEPRADGAAAVY